MMINYKYVHSGNDYVPKLSLPAESESYGDNLNAFESVRTRMLTAEGAFVYAPFGDEFVMAQSANDGRYLFVHGLRGRVSELGANTPAQYMDRLDKSDRGGSAVLEDGTLPKAGAPGRVSDEGLKDVFGKLFDALVYDREKRPIVIYARTQEEAKEYVRVLSSLLPDAFARKVGISVGSPAVAGNLGDVNGYLGNAGDALIRVWASQFDGFYYENFVEGYYVFDTARGRDNYDGKPSVASRCIDELTPYDAASCLAFRDAVAPAFLPYGGVDEKELDTICSGLLFETLKSVDSACEVLRIGPTYDEGWNRVVGDAVGCVVGHAEGGKVPEDVLRLALEEAERNRTVMETSGNTVYEHLERNLSRADGTGMSLLASIIASDATRRRLDGFLKSSASDPDARPCAFEVCALMVSRRMEGFFDFRTEDDRELCRAIISGFGLPGFVPSYEDRATGEQIFMRLKGFEPGPRRMLCALLMYSAYLNGVSQELQTVRISGFTRLENECAGSAEDRLADLIGVNGLVCRLSDALSFPGGGKKDASVRLRDEFDFVFDNPQGSAWIKSQLSELKMENALKIYETLKSDETRYPAMQRAVEDILLDAEAVDAFLDEGASGRERYVKFFNVYTRNGIAVPGKPIDERTVRIGEMLDSLSVRGKACEALKDYRCGFMRDCLDSFRDAYRSRIDRDGPGMDAEKAGLVMKDFEKRIGGKEKGGGIGAWIRCATAKSDKGREGLWALLFAVVTFAMMWVPALVVPVISGNASWAAIWETFTSYFMPAMALIPAAVFLLHAIICYSLRVGDGIKRTNKTVSVFCLIPMAFFDVAYVLVYVAGLALFV